MAYFIGKTEDDRDIYGVDFDIEVKETKQAEDGKRTISMIGSTPNVDRDGDTINQSGWDTIAFKKNSVVQWAHNHDIPAIGRANKFKKSKEALDFQEIEFPKEGIHPFADMIYSLMESGFIKMGSVGFIPIKHEKREPEEGEAGHFWCPTNFIKQELLEFSIVNVGSNRDALVYLQGKGFKGADVNKLFDSMMTQDKRAIPYKKYPLDDEDATWNGPKEVAAAEVSDLKKMSTWVDPEQDDVKAGYKLPHHRADGYNTVWRGVAAAMAALLGARGGVDIPDGERKGVFNHLAKHYDEFSKDIPEFKAVELDALDLDKKDSCLECGKDANIEDGEQFAHEGKCPLCKDCFDKAKGADKDDELKGLLCDDCSKVKDKKPFIARGIDPIVYRCQECDEKHTGKVEENQDDAEESKFEPVNIYKTIERGAYIECWTDEKGEGGFLLPKDILAELEKAGAVLNRANKKKLKDAIELIGDVLASAEPAEEDGKDTTDTKPQPPKEVNLKDVVDKLDMLIKAITSLGDTQQASKTTEDDEIDLEDEAPDEINLEELEIPPCLEKDKDEVDLDTLSKVLGTLRQEQLETFKSALNEELKKATGVVD